MYIWPQAGIPTANDVEGAVPRRIVWAMREEMKSRINLHGLRASLSRGAKSVAQALRRIVALSLVLLLLPVELLAQQAYPYNAQYPQPAYGQQGYPPPQPYGQPGYSQPQQYHSSPTIRNSSPTIRNSNHTDNRRPIPSSSRTHHNRLTPATAKARCSRVMASRNPRCSP